MTTDSGRSPDGSGYSAEPEPISVVSAVPVSIPNAARAFEQIAFVAAEAIAVREAGFTTEAFKYPRSEAGLVALCAFNGIKPEQAPRGWRYYPNAGMKAAWKRVAVAMWERSVAAIAEEARNA